MVANTKTPRALPTDTDAATAQRTLSHLLTQACQTFEAVHTQWEQIAAAPAQIATAPGQQLVQLRQSLQDTLASLGGLIMDWSLRGGLYTLSPPAQATQPLPIQTQQTAPLTPHPPQPPAEPPSAPPPVAATPKPAKAAQAPVKIDRAALEASMNKLRVAPQPPALSEGLRHAQAILLTQAIESCVEVKTSDAFQKSFQALNAMTKPTSLLLWEELPHNEQVLLVECLTAQVRYLQVEVPKDLRPAHALGDNALNPFIARLGGHTRETQCGFAHGLKLDHAPKGRAWREDVLAHLGTLCRLWSDAPAEERAPFNMEVSLDHLRDLIADGAGERALTDCIASMLAAGAPPTDPRLCDLLRDHHDALMSSSTFKKLRRAIRDHLAVLRAEEAQADVAEADPILTQLREAAAGKRVAIIGGDHLGQAQARLSALLPDAKIDWTPTHAQGGTIQAQNLTNAISYGSVDVVLVLSRFISHKVSNKILDAARHARGRVSFAYVPRGYGMRQLCMSLGEALGLWAATAATKGTDVAEA